MEDGGSISGDLRSSILHLIADFRAWPYSSYHALCSTQPTRMCRDEVLAWIGGEALVEAAYQTTTVDSGIPALLLEDLM